MPTVKATFTADISQFRQSLAQASTAVSAFDRTVGQVAGELKKFGNQFSGATLKRQAETMAKAIADIGGASRLTESEMKRANATISEAMAKYKALGTEAPASVRNLSQELQKLNAESAKVGTTAATAGKGFSSLFAGMAQGAGMAVFNAALGSLKELAGQAAAFTPLKQSFEQMQGGATQAASSLLGLRVATKGLVSDIDLLRAANKGSLLGLGDMGIKFDEVARVATVLGRAMGQDAAKSVDDLTTALSRMSPQILDNLGIKVDLAKATEDYAKANHKSVESLTEEEKKLAFAQAAMAAATAKAKALGDIQLTVWDNTQKITTALGDMTIEVMSAGNESKGLAHWLGQVADMLDRIRAIGVGRAARVMLNEALASGQSAIQGPSMWAQGMSMLPGPLGALGSYFSTPYNVMGGMRGRLGVTQEDLNAVLFPPAAGATVTPGAGGGGGGTGPTKEQLAAIKQWNDEIAELTGAKRIADGARLAKQLLEIAAAGKALPADSIEAVAQRLMHARAAADQTGAAFRAMGAALNTLQIQAGRIPGGGMMGLAPSISSQNAGLLPSSNPTANMLIGLAPSLTGKTQQIVWATKNWQVALEGVAQAFAQLAQVGGPALQGINQTVGTAFAAANAGQQMVAALAQMVGGLTTTKDGKTVQTGAGKALSGGLAGLSAGMSVGSLFTNRGKGFVAGAASGAAAGGMTGSWVGAGVGALVGAFAGMFAAAANAAAQRVAKDVQAGQLTAEFGGLDKLLDVVGQLGMNQGGFLKAFYGEPKAFAQAITQLNQALAKERQEADKLVKSLSEVARVQGVLSRQQLKAMTGIRPGGPGSEELVAFAAQQRTQAEGGITQAVAALVPSLSDQEIDRLTKDIKDEAEKARIIEAELARKSAATLQQFGLGAKAAASGLFVAFSEAVQQGESAIDVLARLQQPIQQLQQLYQRAGITPGAGFQNLQVLSNIATGQQTGPAVQMAQGLGAALAGFQNSGLLSPELFGELANGIGEAYHQLELFGQGGLEAARLMQPSLQAIWQMLQDNPALADSLDATTLSLLDFAEKSGLIGEAFRPAIDQMIDALDALIVKIEELIATMAGVPALPGGATPGVPPPTTIPLAAGGVVTRPTLALVGEAGPEAVIPLSKLGASGGRALNITVPVVVDGRQIARVVVRRMPGQAQLYTEVA